MFKIDQLSILSQCIMVSFTFPLGPRIATPIWPLGPFHLHRIWEKNSMGRQIRNDEVVQQLRNSLQAFLDDHRSHAQRDPQWLDETSSDSPKEIELGCGCDECLIAGHF